LTADRRFAAVLACFALSGFAALLYQTAWLREFAFVFGTAELAVVSVLAAYMAGLAGGAAVAARIANRIQRPVRVYGALELGIALCALAVPWAIRASTQIYVWAFGGRPEPPDEGQLAGTVFFAASSFLILAIPTGLMGVTLPLLARYAVRSREEIGRRIGALYAINTAGAVLGTLCAAFLLLPSIGLRSTVYVGAATNALVFVIAALIARGATPLAQDAERIETAAGEGRAILPLIAISGAISFSFEVMWTRLLGQVLGGSIYAFATMLASFLLGITLGSAIASRFATDPRRSAYGFSISQIGIAATTVAAFFALDSLPAWARNLGAGYHGSLLSNAIVAAIFLLPAALFIGATFPFAVRILARHESQAAAASARVYAWNTSGSIVGALTAGLALLPVLGFEGLLQAATATSLILAIASAALVKPLRPWPVVVSGVGLIALLVLPPNPPWRVLRTNPSNGNVGRGKIAYYSVGRSATVLLLDNGLGWRLSTNGLSEAEIRPDGVRPGQAATTRWLSMLPVLARPESRTLLLVGLGGGLTLQAVPSSVEQIDVIELEPEVVAANRAVSALRDRDPLADPRANVHVNDARGSLMLTDRRYDVVISQPSHPWTAGASHLYTREFFGLVRDHLTPGGVFSQWIGLRFVDADLLRMLIATLLDTFANVRLYQPVPGSVVFLASDDPLSLEIEGARALAATPAEFARYGLRSPEDLLAGLALDEAGTQAFSDGARVNTDHDNRVAARSPRLGARESMAFSGATDVFGPFESIAPRSRGFDRAYVARRICLAYGEAKALRFAEALAEGPEKQIALGWIDLMNGRPRAARTRFRDVLGADAASFEAQSGLLLLERARLLRGEAAPGIDSLGPLDAAGKTLLIAWKLRARGALKELQALDESLSQVDARHPLHSEAVRSRVWWRVGIGGESLGREAFQIIDQITPVRPVLSDLLMRSRAALAAGSTLGAVSTLEEMSGRIKTAEQARSLLALLDQVPPSNLDRHVERLRNQMSRIKR
jgi:spermidine synthase